MAKILVAEDDEYLKELYTIFLEAVNHEIVIASSANEVKKTLHSFTPDVILLDVMLGNDDGRKICKDIKQKKKDVKVILLSADDKLLADYKAYEADAAIPKPFRLQDVLEMIDNLLRNDAA